MSIRLAPGTFFGQTRGKLEVAGLTFAESVYEAAPELDLPLHSHEDAFLYFVIEGVSEEIHRKGTRTNGPSTLAYHPAGEPHANRWLGGTGGRIMHIDISNRRAEAICEYAAIGGGPAASPGGAAPWLAERLYREYCRPDGPSTLALEGLALEILAEMFRGGSSPPAERTPPRWLLRARELLRDRLGEETPLGRIAAEVDAHPVHLARAFRQHYGCTPGEYLRKARVEFACGKLAGSDVPLVEIALAAGFADQSHFTKTFRREMRMTPGEFRRHFRAR